ncbi:MAG: amidohydrolase family protein [Thermomicrobiales bacterium]
MTANATRPTKGNEPLIFDADIHVNDTPQALAPYCDMPWQKSLELLGQVPQRYLDIPGFATSMKLDPPIPGGHAGRSVYTPQGMRDELAALGIGGGILLPDNLLLFAALPNIEYATEVSHAYNRWLVAEWLQEQGRDGLYGAIMACPQNPEDSAREIERYAKTPGVVAVYLPTAGVNPLWGHRKYDPILAAAEAADLPVMLHSVTIVSPVFPAQLEQFENHFARQILSHSFAMMANLTSLMHTGVPARYPNLKVVFTEAGIAWVPYMMWRMDKYHQEYRRMVPFLEERPSDYMKRSMWFATQPVEEPDDPAHLVETIRHYSGMDRTVFASDWPHHDFDHPRALLKLPLTAEERHKIMWQNAADLFKIPTPARLAV